MGDHAPPVGKIDQGRRWPKPSVQTPAWDVGMDKDGKHYPDRADDNDSHPRLVYDAKGLGHPRKDSQTVRRRKAPRRRYGETSVHANGVPLTVAWNV